MPSSGVQTCALDRKSTRLNSSHTLISYAVFCLKKDQNLISGRQAGGARGPRAAPAGDARAPHSPLSLRVSRPVPPPAGWPPLAVFFLKDTAPTEIYAFSLHDALPI